MKAAQRNTVSKSKIMSKIDKVKLKRPLQYIYLSMPLLYSHTSHKSHPNSTLLGSKQRRQNTVAKCNVAVRQRAKQCTEYCRPMSKTSQINSVEGGATCPSKSLTDQLLFYSILILSISPTSTLPLVLIFCIPVYLLILLLSLFCSFSV